MCDTLCVLNDDGSLFAKASDRPFGEAQVVESFPARTGGATVATQYLTLPDPGAAAFLGGRPVWLWGVEHGVNEHRVAVGNERVWTTGIPDPAPDGLLGMDLVRLALERARSADEAVDHITDLVGRHGQAGIGEQSTGEAYFSSFLVTDPERAWIIETSGRTWVAEPVDPTRRGAAISNRLSITTGWTRASSDVAVEADFQAWRDPDYPTPHADQRIAATSAVARRDPPPTARDLAGVLRHHGVHAWGEPGSPTGTGPGTRPIDPVPAPRISRDGTGVSVCMHLRNWETTTGSMIAALPRDPDEPERAWVTLANPCVAVFLPVFPPDGVPAAWTTTELWDRFDALRDRVEQDPRALAAVRAVFDPVEATLWDEADEVAARPDPAGRVRFLDHAAEAVLGALATVETQVGNDLA